MQVGWRGLHRSETSDLMRTAFSSVARAKPLGSSKILTIWKYFASVKYVNILEQKFK